MKKIRIIMKKIMPCIIWNGLRILKRQGVKMFCLIACEKLFRANKNRKGFDFLVNITFSPRKDITAGQTDRIVRWKRYVYLKKRYSKMLDTLPNYALLESSEKPNVIWMPWLQGEDNAPDIVRACMDSVRTHYIHGGV